LEPLPLQPGGGKRAAPELQLASGKAGSSGLPLPTAAGGPTRCLLV